MKETTGQRGRHHGAWVIALAVSASIGCGPVYYGGDDGSYAAGAQAEDPSVAWGELAAWGVWAWSSQWGRVWVPYANRTPGWRPYTVGGWVYTSYGWTWNATEPFGWAVYHYGRWGWDHGIGGWVWVPGRVWGPAWVAWRSGGGCVGWAPLGPGGVVYNQHHYWVFVQHQHVHTTNVQTVIVAPQAVPTVYQQSVVIGARAHIRDERGGAVSYNAGPAPRDVQTWTGQPVQPRQIQEVPSAVPRQRAAAAAPASPRPSADPRYGGGDAPRRESPSGYAPTPRPAPSYQPSTPRPAPSYEAAPRPAPSSQPEARPAPSYRPEARPEPSYEASPRPAPSYQPSPRPAPSYQPGAAAPRGGGGSPYAVQPRSSSGGSRGSAASPSSGSSSRGSSSGGRSSPPPRR